MEKKIVPTLINFRGSEIWAILVNRFGNKGKTRISWILVGFLFLGTGLLFAAEPVKKESALKKIAAVEKRGLVNFLTTPAEFVYALKGEMKDYPKAWPLTYIPRAFAKMAIRVGSSVNDFTVLPWCAAKSDAQPLTRHFDLPDYVWEKE